MLKKICFLILQALLLSVGGFGTGPVLLAQRLPEAPSTVSLPQAYHHVFAHIGYLNETARKAEGQGADATKHRVLYRHVAKLTPAQAIALDRVALDCLAQLAPLDTRAKALTTAYRQQFPIPAGKPIPPPPAELKEIGKHREAVILQARDRLRKEFGLAEFTRFETFVLNLVKSS